MKKILAAALALLMVLGSVLLLASCGPKPLLILEKAEDNLRDEDYTVFYQKSDIDTGVAAYLEASSYRGDDRLTIVKFEKSSTAKLYYEELELEHAHSLETKELRLEYLKKLLKTYEHDLKNNEIEEYEDQIKDLEDEIDDMKNNKDYVFGRSGKYVWYGTPDALKDSK